MACMIERHASHPVVAEKSFIASLLHIQNGNLAAFHIIYRETFAVYRNVKVALCIVSHTVDAGAGKGEFLLVCTCMRVVAVECAAIADPVIATSVFIDDASTGR